jgi:hypothetical protein
MSIVYQPDVSFLSQTWAYSGVTPAGFERACRVQMLRSRLQRMNVSF